MRDGELGGFLKNYHKSIIGYLHDELESSAIAYLRAGLDLFHESREMECRHSQPAIGNLGIAVELMLKTLIVKHNPYCFFWGCQMKCRSCSRHQILCQKTLIGGHSILI